MERTKIVKVTVPQEKVNYIERLDYEVGSIKALLLDAAERGIVSSKAIDSWKREYHEKYTEFELAKNEMTEEYARPVSEGKDSIWTLDYKTCIMTVTLKGVTAVEEA